MLLTFENLIKVLDDLARAYRQTNGLDGAYDKPLLAAEMVLKKYADITASQTKRIAEATSGGADLP
jgi:hypothetical protein